MTIPHLVTGDFRTTDQLNALVDALNAGLQSVTIPLSSTQLKHLLTAPVTVVEAAAGKVALPRHYTFCNKFGTVPYAAATDVAGLYYTDTAGVHPTASIDITTTANHIVSGNIGTIDQASSALVNKPLVFACPSEPALYGAIAASAKAVGGTGYAPGDTGHVTTGDGLALYTVLTVSSGAVLTYSLAGGGDYAVANGVATTVATGGGDGAFTVNITAITPGDGTAQLTVVYEVVTFPT